MHILLSLTLSVMIVIMGSGLTVVHCNHTGTTSVVTFGQACKKKCKPSSKCMHMSVIKGSTMAQAQVLSLEHTLPIHFLPWLAKPLYEFISFPLAISSEVMGKTCLQKHGPPRDYLNLICILLIQQSCVVSSIFIQAISSEKSINIYRYKMDFIYKQK